LHGNRTHRVWERCWNILSLSMECTSLAGPDLCSVPACSTACLTPCSISKTRGGLTGGERTARQLCTNIGIRNYSTQLNPPQLSSMSTQHMWQPCTPCVSGRWLVSALTVSNRLPLLIGCLWEFISPESSCLKWRRSSPPSALGVVKRKSKIWITYFFIATSTRTSEKNSSQN